MLPVVARDISSCSRCPQLVLPGDEVYVEKENVSHREHTKWDNLLPGEAFYALTLS